MTQKKANKINTISPDMNAERLAEFRRLFPDLFDGEGQLDEQALRQIVQPDQSTGIERFCFDWVGKQDSKRHAFTPSKGTLVADEKRSVNFDKTENLIIEGDNLEVLKLMQATYFEQVKCIYIDPPYNTTNDFIYPDDYTETKKAYWQKNGTVKNGVKLVANSEAAGRKHSNWLSMMQSRLLAARHLLRPDGVIFISIDDNEVYHLRKLCNEVFGEENFVNEFIWVKNSSGKTVSKEFPVNIDHVLMYKKSSAFDLSVVYKPLAESTIGTYKRDDKDGRGKYSTVSMQKTKDPGPDTTYDYMDNTGKVWLCPDKGWRMVKDKVKKLENDGRLYLEGKTIREKSYWDERKNEGKVADTLWDDISENHIGTGEVKKLFGVDVFDNPKPTALVERCLKIGSDNGDIVLDFFAGSGTTAHTVMQMNAENKGNRRYILVQVPEYTDEKTTAYKKGYKTISALCIERAKRAGKKVLKENPKVDIDTGFRVYKLTESHFPENLFKSNPDKSEKDNIAALKAHLETASQTNLFKEDELADIITEISLKNGYGLFFTLEQIKDFDGNTVYRLSGNDKDTLLCLDEELHDGSIEILAAQHSEDQLIVSKRALDTAKTWTLQNAFGDNLRVV